MGDHVERGGVEWKTSLWTLPCHYACPLSLFCPCAVYYKTAELLTGGGYTTSCCRSIVCGCCCYGGLNQRGMLREKYNLKGGECSDFWMHCCCQCLALGQVYRETRLWARDPTVCCPKAQAEAERIANEKAARVVRPGHPHDLDSSREDNEDADPKRRRVKVGPTPTERYDQLLTDLGALNTNLGKNPVKTICLSSVPPKGRGSTASDVQVDASGNVLDDADVLSEKEYELHRDFLGVPVDSGKLIEDPRNRPPPVPGSIESQHTPSQSSSSGHIVPQDRQAYFASRISESIPDVPDAALAKALGDGHPEF